MGKAVTWTHQANAELHQEFLKLLEESESIETTTRVITEVYESSFELSKHSEIYKLDTLKSNNKGNIRAYEKHTYRVSYQIEANAIYIIRVRYARKEPLSY